MADFVTITMKTEVAWQAVIDAKPDSDIFSKFQPGRKLFMADLGLRHLRRSDGQAIYMEHYDGATPAVKIEDIINLDATALAANHGKIRFWLTDEVRASIESGEIKKLIALGILDAPVYSSYP